jgi:hypothetical protein
MHHQLAPMNAVMNTGNVNHARNARIAQRLAKRRVGRNAQR